MKKDVASYGQAGGQGQGQPYSRFQIQSDPTPYIPWWAAGGMVCASPAHMIGDTGGAYRYGTLKVGGITNMVSNGEVLRSLVIDQPLVGDAARLANLILGGLGTGKYDAIQQARYVAIKTFPNNNQINNFFAPVITNGEFANQDTTTSLYGATPYMEFFTVAGTVTATNGSTAIVGAGTNFTTATLPGYGYVPSFNLPRMGDIIEIINAGSSAFYRITFITDATHLTIFPAYNQGTSAGLVYKIWRIGYGSWSRTHQIANGNGWNVYYAGNTTTNQTLTGSSGGQGFGTIQCVDMGNLKHFMAPQSGGVDVRAVDVAYYKSFLLYGFGSTIGWSVAGFPTSFATGFGATDFPALNISAIAPDDVFVCFEFLGDQLIALFLNSMWLVQSTGIVPEFAFYKLTEPVGVLHEGIADPQLGGSTNNVVYTRPSASSRGTTIYVNPAGLQVLQAGAAQRISVPVENYDFPGADNNFNVSWDAASNCVSWSDALGTRCLIYDLDQRTWTQLDLTATLLAKGFTGSVVNTPLPQRQYRSFSFGYWSGGKAYLVSSTIERDNTTFSQAQWTAASPIFSVGQVYNGWRYGGFLIMARAAAGAAIPTNLSWTLYGGSNPYQMKVRDSGLYDYATNFVDSRAKIGKMIDDPYFAIVLQGSYWIELTGVMFYPADSTAAA